MRKLLIIPVLIVVAVVRIIFHVAEKIVSLPCALLKAVADEAGAILKELIKGERYVKSKKSPGEIIGQVSSEQSKEE